MAKKQTPSGFTYRPAPKARQSQIFYDPLSYSAFPHVIRMDGDELLIAFRQAPRQKGFVRHTHPRSVITVIRSYDNGANWETENASQLAAGGGQELGLIYLGNGKVGGALAAHEVVPASEQPRSGFPHLHKIEYPFINVGGLWCWSDNYGLTWRVEHTVLFADKMQCCAPPVQLSDSSLLIPVYGSIGQATNSSSTLHRSTDGGASWSQLAIMARGKPQARGYAEPVVMELSPGHLLGLHRVGNPKGEVGIFWRNESTDNGKTWSRTEATTIKSGACPRLLKLRDGRLLLTYGRRFEPYGIYASLSEDNGQTWGETSWLLRKTPDSNQGYSSSVELDDGRIFTACYARNSRDITGITGTFWHLP
jgi:hypothetical protein